MSDLYLDNAGSFPECSKDILDWCRTGEKPESFSCNAETVERLPLPVNQALSKVGEKTGWKGFPPETVPLLSGVHRHSQMLGLRGIGTLRRVLSALEAKGVPAMLLKGLAFKAFYGKGQARLMNDFDIAVPESRFREAVGLLRDNGIKVRQDCSPQHVSVDAEGKAIELHRWIFKNNGERGSGIWNRAVGVEFAGARALVPAPADMLIHQLDNRSRDLFLKVFDDRELPWLLDMEALILEHPEALKGLAERAFGLGVAFSAARMTARLESVFPGTASVPDGLKDVFRSGLYRKWLESGEALRAAAPRFRRAGRSVPAKAAFHLRQFRHLRLDRLQGGRRFTVGDYLNYVFRRKG